MGSASLCQTAASKPAFEVADVRVSPRSVWVNVLANNLQGGFLRGDRYELKHATMLDLIQTAYGVDADNVFGGPSRLEYDKYEVAAKTRPGTKPETLRLMLQSLLEERFKLVVKPDTKPVPAFTAGKEKPKLKDAGGTGGGCITQPSFVGDTPLANIRCRNVTMEAFAVGLRRLTPATFENLPVVAQTGIERAFDIDLQYALIPVANAKPGTGGLPPQPNPPA